MTNRGKRRRIKDDLDSTKLEVRDWSSADIDSLWTWSPDRRSDVYVHVELEIGNRGREGADLFQVVVATPEGLRARAAGQEGVIEDRAIIVVSDFSWPDLERRLTQIVASCNGFSWSDAVQKLQRYFRWEYEDERLD